MPSDRVWRFSAPVLVPLVAFLAAVVADGVLTYVLIRDPIAFWLMRHEGASYAMAIAQLASFAASSAVAVYAIARFLARRERASSAVSAHIRHCGFLYVVLLVAIVAHVRCLDSCEGLVFGSIKFYAMLALGGIVADGWALRRQGAVALA
jgi:hypothetical protein